MALDLSYFFAQYGKKFVRELTDKVRRRVGIDGVPYDPISRYTAKGTTVTRTKRIARRAGMDKVEYYKKEVEVKRPLDSRLNNTLQFRENAFESDSTDVGIEVRVSEDTYPGESVSYADIVSYNDVNSDEVNPRIKGGKDPHNPPAIFPMGDDAQALVEGLDTYQEMDEALRRVVEIQLTDEADKINLNMKIHIGG